ncbi:hypothetical protein RhiirC2_858077 [Rhizophagus irregularis]|uniref:Uncharacterized protein n=1 Tax=Rhizophagus irregularis TaxID=588596 RepID=A0A2N1M820_9GLOM|nr:hypothetical protein RhiirC2_858077 [Rhizophagus irregularis]
MNNISEEKIIFLLDFGAFDAWVPEMIWVRDTGVQNAEYNNIKDTVISNVVNIDYALYYHSQHGPYFGDDIVI